MCFLVNNITPGKSRHLEYTERHTSHNEYSISLLNTLEDIMFMKNEPYLLEPEKTAHLIWH